MKKAYLYRLYAADEQAALLQQQLDVAREVYNACLVGGIIKTVTLKRGGRRWYAVIVCEVAVVPLPATGFGMAAAGRLV